ncbi:MAG: hypothetical protein GEV03_19630 [Streptosporangiales bacterium]|nr:hypothetical protein [Streptosporangiales bacterium]
MGARAERVRNGLGGHPGVPLALASLAACALTALAGCGLLNRPGENERYPATYDLREPPARADVGMADGDKVVVHETDESRAVTVRLPEGHSLKTDVNLVTFDTYGAGTGAERADPTGADMHTARIPLDEAAEVLSASLDQLGAPDAAVRPWVDQAKSATGTDDIRSEYVRKRLGYLTMEVQGRYSPMDRRASVAYTLHWEPAGPK